MKLLLFSILLGAANAFAPHFRSARRSKAVVWAQDPNFDLSGNIWKPTEGRMQSSDTPDYLPTRQEDIDMVNDLDFTDGIYGSQVANDDQDRGPGLPGMERVGEDALMSDGIEVHEDIPDGMEFIPASVPDGAIEIQLPSLSSSQLYTYEIKPFCMGYEDYYAAFTQDSSTVFRIQDGAVGRMDRRGGESVFLDIMCETRGHEGVFEGTIVVNLPDDGSKLTYTIKATTPGA